MMNKTILLIDDDDLLVDLLSRILELNHYHVLKASSAEIARDLLIVEMVDLIISDHKLPVADGLDLAFSLRDNRETASIPFILLTGMSINNLEADDLLDSIEIIQKPFDVNSLLHTMESNLRQSNA